MNKYVGIHNSKLLTQPFQIAKTLNQERNNPDKTREAFYYQEARINLHLQLNASHL